MAIQNLVARGISHAQSMYSKGDGTPKTTYNLPTWGVLLIFFTTLAFFLMYVAVRYTYGTLVPILAMIENPNASVIPARAGNSSSDADPIDPDLPLLNNYRTGGNKVKSSNGAGTPPPAYEDEERLVVPTKPITSSFRLTVRHLRARAGFFSRFRGIQIQIIKGTIATILVALLSSPFSGAWVSLLITIPVSVLMVRFTMAYIHHVISEPAHDGPQKSWIRRLKDGKSARKIIPAVLVYAIAEQLCVAVPAAIGYCFNLHSAIREPGLVDTDGQRALFATKGLAAAFSGVLVGLFFLLPANVVLTRVAASLLPDDDETIIPFDRSFGGKVVPAIVGGSGSIGMREAWTSFGWEARVRLVKVYIKSWAMALAVIVGWLIVTGLELKLVLSHSDKKTEL